MSGGSDSQTVGYRYFMGLHFGICYGPVDRFRRLIWGDRKAWAGELTASGEITIASPNLFGGDEREGGIAGKAQVMMGTQTQTLPTAVSSALPSPSPAFRGVFSVYYDGQISSNNPYVKPPAFKVQRILSGWNGGTAWYPEKAPIGSITPGHGALTLLQSRFIGANAGDESAFAHGDPVQDGGTIADGHFEVNRANGSEPNTPSALTYEAPALETSGTDALTVEFFATWSETPNIAYTKIVSFTKNTGDPTNTLHKFGYYGAAGLVCYDNFSAGIQYTSASPVSGKTHFAIVFSATGTRVYIAGVKVWETGGDTRGPNAPMKLVIGDDVGYTSDTTSYIVEGFRVQQEEVYTGASFTPPTSIPDPDGEADSTGNLLMNPAHIIYQCVTDPAWGMAYPTASIDTTSFTAAADTLYAENFGLCLLWNRSDEIGAFIRNVLDHIGAVFYSDPKTGKFGLKLLRDDYTPASLPVYDEGNIIELSGFQRVGYGDMVNEITVVFRDVDTNKDTPVTVQNLATVQAQGGVVSQTRQYPGIPNAALALRVAMRDLVAASTPLAKAQMRVNRNGWQLFPGDVFKLDWPKLGLVGVIFRVLGVDYGALEDGSILVDIAEDVFGLPASTYAAQEPSGWTEPDTKPKPITDQALIEAPYRSIVSAVTAAELAQVDPDAAFFSGLAARPSLTSQSIGIYSRAGAAAFQPHGNGRFVPFADLGGALTITATSATLSNGIDLAQVKTGSIAIIGTGAAEEWVLVTAIDANAGTMTISRGILDTTPKAHSSGEPVFFDDGLAAPDRVERATGEVVQWKMTTKATGGELTIDQVSAVTATAAQRLYRPYPPGNVKVNGVAYPTSAPTPPLVFTWSHRDRLQQTADYVEQDEGNIGPEAGTTYTLELRNASTNALMTTQTGITGTTATPPALPQGGSYTIKARLWAVRGGLASWQAHEFTFPYVNTDPVPTGSGSFTVRTSLVFPSAGSTIALALSQAAQATKAATGWRSTITLGSIGGGSIIGIGAVLTSQFTRYYTVGAQLFGDVEQVGLTFSSQRTRAQALGDWAAVANLNTVLRSYGWNIYSSGTEAAPTAELFGPVGQEWDVLPTPPGTPPASVFFGLVQSIADRGGPAITTPLNQLVTATIGGSPTAGDRITVTLGGTEFGYTVQSGATTSSVATGLAAVIDASPSYAASAVGAVVTIDGLTPSNAYTYAATVSGPRAYAA